MFTFDLNVSVSKVFKQLNRACSLTCFQPDALEYCTLSRNVKCDTGMQYTSHCDVQAVLMPAQAGFSTSAELHCLRFSTHSLCHGICTPRILARGSFIVTVQSAEACLLRSASTLSCRLYCWSWQPLCTNAYAKRQPIPTFKVLEGVALAGTAE